MDPSLYINRELSWLEFNQRVLDQARDPENPLLERLKFLCIVSSNLDEFFEVRVAGLKQQRQSGSSETAPDGLTASQALEAISTRVGRMVKEQYQCWHEEIKPGLEAAGIRFHDYPNVPDDQKKAFEEFYSRSVHPVLTPLALDPAHPFPQLLNKSLNVIVELEGEDLNTDVAIVQVPRILPRVLPFHGPKKEEDFVFLGHVIQAHVGSLFHGVRVRGAHLFRITRNSNLYFDEEEAENLLKAIEAELRKVNRGNAVRLEVEEQCPAPVVERLVDIFNLDAEDVFRIPGPLNFVRLMPLALQLDRPDLRYRRFTPDRVASSDSEADLFFHIRKGDILLHHPYDSFQTVVDFLALAAEDPHVLAIKQTLYRTGGDPRIERAADCLERAAHLARIDRRAGDGKHMAADFVAGKQAGAPSALAHHGQPPKAPLPEPGKGLIHRLVEAHRDHVGFHHVAHPWPHIGEECRSLEAKARKRVVNPLIGGSAAPGHRLAPPASPLEFGVGHCGTDRIHVGVAVADHKSLHETGQDARLWEDGKVVCMPGRFRFF
ncbi:MAG: polyphosphate kinase [Terrimicrobiaceae bacterium]|nr:polyphosphate kinase [Terrimicrobiaceae bacterium]